MKGYFVLKVEEWRKKMSKNLKTCCPRCESSRAVRNGMTAGGLQNYRCRDCGRQFVLNPRKRQIDAKVKKIIHLLLADGVKISVIARATQVSQRWLYKLKKKGLQNDRKYGRDPAAGSGASRAGS